MFPRALVVAFALAAPVPSVVAQGTLAPGELVIGSRLYGTLFAPLHAPGVPSQLLSGPDLSNVALPIRGAGPSLSCSQLAILAMSVDRLIVSPSGSLDPGLYRIDMATGNRTLLPGTNGPLWTGGGEMLALDSDTLLAIADDYAAAAVGDGKLLQYRISTGQTTLISGIARGDGVVMHRPRAIARLDDTSVAVMEFGEAVPVLPGSILYRVNLLTGDRTVLSTLSPLVPSRYSSTAGVRSALPAAVPLVGTGPTFLLGNRGVAVVGSRIFVSGTADNSYLGGIVDVDPVTGDRTLVGGSARQGVARVTVPLGAGSDPYTPDAPTALQRHTDHSFIFTETFGPSRVWEFDINTRQVRAVADLDAQILSQFRAGIGFTGLARVPCGNDGAGFVITTQPISASVCPQGSAAFTLGASSAGPFTYQWEGRPSAQAEWVALNNGESEDFGTVAGAASGTLVISSAVGSGASFRAIVSNTCGSVTSDPATLTICAADFDCNGTREVPDIFAFLSSWFAQDVRADFDGIPGITVADIFAFLSAWFAGCP